MRLPAVLSETLGQGSVGAGVNEAGAVQAGEGEDPVHRGRRFADGETPTLGSYPPVRQNDGGDPGGVDEVALVEADEDVKVLFGGGIQPPLEPIDNGHVKLACDSQLAAFAIQTYLMDRK